MRILFLGAGEFGLPTLAHLHAEHELVAVFTQPDRPAGRRRKLAPTPIAQWAETRELNVHKVEDANAPEVIEQVRAYQPDASIVVAFGQKLSPELIEALGGLAVNVHGSLLPAYRGAAPVNWAVINNERTTGITVIGLAQRMDAGLIYGKASLSIAPRETAGEVHDRLAELGPEVVADVLQRHEAGTLQGEAQDESRASRAPKLKKADGTVSFDQPADAARARIHGLTPWPGCRVHWHCQADGKTHELMLRRVEAMPEAPAFLRQRFGDDWPAIGTVVEPMLVIAGAGVVKLLEVQAPGTRAMDAAAFGRGHHLMPGDRLAPIGRD